MTVAQFQQVWQRAAEDVMALCAALAALYGMAQPADASVRFDWGNGVLFDEEKVWADYLTMADKGLIEECFGKFGFAVVVNLAAQAGVRYSITNPDAYIEAMVTQVGSNYNLRVATSDSLVQLSSLRSGVLRMSARELQQEVETACKDMRKYF